MVRGNRLGRVPFVFTDELGLFRIDAEAIRLKSELVASRLEASGCYFSFGALSTGTRGWVPVPIARGNQQREEASIGNQQNFPKLRTGTPVAS